MKLIPVLYYGFTGMDSRFSTPMLPWIVSEIRKRDYCEKLSLGVEYGVLQAYNPDFELQFSHRILQMIRFSQADLDPSTFLYLLKDDAEKTLYCYMYQAPSVAEVAELYKQMKDQSTLTPSRTTSSAANLTSLCVDISPSLSNFFEVLYIGKIKVWNKKVPDTFIDDALEKFKAYELEKKHKAKLLGNIGRLRSEDNIRRGSSSDSISSNDSYTTNQRPHLQRSLSTSSNLVARTSDIQLADQAEISKSLRVERVKSIEEHSNENQAQPVNDEKDEEASPKTAVPENIDDHNRTMVLQIDRTDLRLISPDRKVILLHKHHKDVAACIQGQLNGEHFGFVSKETSNTQNYIGYIFKCESSNIASDAVAAINQAFSSAETRPKPMITSCDHCPMIWFHRLCTEIEHLSDRKTQAAILRRIEQLDDEEQTIIMTKFRGAETNSMIEQNEFLMMLLRAHCESKQTRHVHDTAENRSEFLNQYLGGGTIFMKAKRSLSNSFEMLKKRASRDDFSSTLKEMNLPLTHSLNRETSPHSPTMSVTNDQSDKESEGMRSRSSTIGSQSDLHLSVRDNTNKSSVSPDRISMGSEKMPKSPMMDIFMKVGSPKSNSAEEGTTAKTEAGSWRHAIFKKVLTPNKLQEDLARKRSNEELKDLWKKSIHQAVLLVRMEKENARLKAKQEESAVKRIKLEYDEMKPSQRAVMEVWDLITSKSNTRVKTDRPMLLEAVKQGVPRGKRGEVWQFLAEQYSMTIPPVDTEKYPNYNVPYDTLLKQLTAHQHAILIDLGRTFPSHSYFSSPLGPGQLALFNLLKAYSLLDPEVGYCQGVSFIVGVLLLHMEESQAFYLLTHLMFRRGLRKQYLPDMTGLQVRLYQLSRLLHDKLPDLYVHFNDYDIAPTLYAAPWLLTIFASQFPLGFVTRVFDLVFLEGVDVVFRVALSMLVYHKDKLMACDGFEEIMNYLKNTVTTIDKPVLEKIMKFVYINDISKQLEEYRVEYQVLQEEMIAVQPQVESVHRLEQSNKRLIDQNKALTSQLELALTNVQRLEKHRTLQQSQVNKLEMHTRGLEVTIATLGNFINNLVETKADVEIPDEVRRIISQIIFSERRKTELKGQNNLMKMFQTPTPVHPNRLMVKSLSTGKIQLDTITDQNELRSNSLNAQTKPKLTFDETVAIRKSSQFFSNTHNNILQQSKVHSNSTLYTGSNAKIDITIQEFENELNTKNNNTPSSPISISNIMSPIGDLKISPTNSVDSGVISPSSPKNLDNHPLSNCDVNFTFNGTKELKTIKSLKSLSRNSSPELLRK